MSAQDKLAVGLTLFTVIFLAALLLVPRSIFDGYRADVRRRKRERALGVVMLIVLALCLPYFYDQLVGLDDHRLSMILEWVIGSCAYLVVIDVAGFLYRHFGQPSRRQPLRRP